jgi:glycosyltransferase involved in cell wall biosynthesis
MADDERPAVAIVMRTRDRPVFLDRALGDVCRQTFADWHLVVVNDGGACDAVDQVVAGHPALAGRSTVLHNADSRGMEAASNQALRAHDSVYVAVHDDDDTWHPDFLARTVAHLEGTEDAAVAVRTEIVWERLDGEQILEDGREIMAPEVHAFTLFQMLRHNRTVPISVLHRRDLHAEVGFFREDLGVVGDWEFYLRVATTEHSLGFLDGEPLAFWHRRRETGGPEANSVTARLDEHREADLLLRDEALRAHARAHGFGDLLYLTTYIQREADNLHGRFNFAERQHEALVARLAEQGELLEQQAARIEELTAAVSDASLVALARRRYRRWKARLQQLTGRAGTAR